MQSLPCPFCGQRAETEFRYVGELGKTRPDTTSDVSDADWADYLYMTRNAKGKASEVWMHLTCAELFALERDTVTMAVIRAITLRKVGA